MLIDWIIEALIELPLLMFGGSSQNTCPKCGNRLRYQEHSHGKRVQCVMCDRVWQRENGQRLRPIDAERK
jgi:hypothetical protein